MPAFFTSLFTVYFFATCAVLYCVSALICLITAPFDRLRRAVHWFSGYWGFHYFQINPIGWKVTYEGTELIDASKTYVLVANHQSLADILVCYGLHKPYKWVSKESIYKVPFIGWNMALNQYVLIRRGDLKSIKEMMENCRSWLKQGASIMMFPEGTRSENGEIQAFRDGAFRLAINCNVEVVPIVIDGTFDILPKGAKHLSFKSNIHVKVLPPVSGADFDNSSGRMRTYVREMMVETLHTMRGQKQSNALTTSAS